METVRVAAGRLAVNSNDSSIVVQVSSTNSTVDDDDDVSVDNAIDSPWRKFVSPEFMAKFQKAVP